MDDKTAVFLPYRCVCSFPDGTRRAFSGLSRYQAQRSMFAYAEQHHGGEYGPWHWVTDENYINGQYHKLYPPPPVLDVPDFDTVQEFLEYLHRLSEQEDGAE